MSAPAIEIVPYDPRWPGEYEAERQRLAALPGLGAVHIEHVGSTAVPGQAAKPIIDIFVAAELLQDAAYYAGVLGTGYTHTPTDMEGRWLFAGYAGGVWRYNIHLLPAEGFYARTEFVIRDYLRAHPGAVAEYTAAKLACAAAGPADMAAYTRAKTAFLQKAYNAALALRGLPPQPVWEGDNNPLNEG